MTHSPRLYRWTLWRTADFGPWQIAGPEMVGYDKSVPVVPAEYAERLVEALVPFACLARRSMERLGVVEEWEIARQLVDAYGSSQDTAALSDGEERAA